jgi:iron-sulfur cluster insertion protein
MDTVTQEPVQVRVSASAAKRIAALTTAEGPAMMFRIAVNGGGCSGYQYEFTFDDTRTDDDVLIERDGARVLIDQVSLEFLGGSEVDFVEGLMGSHFEIKNPNAKSSCGCGTSFSV